MYKPNKTTSLIIYFFLLFVVLFIAFIIRWHNLYAYTTWWADDGGGHLAYVETLLEKKRLPTPADTYLAWHEPLYYLSLAVWIRFGEIISMGGLNWWEGLNILIYFFILALIWLISYFASKKDKWISLLNVFLFSVIFVGVKLSAYVNNELLAQFLILCAIFLFLYFRLLSRQKILKLIVWAIVLSLATLTKLNAYIILFATLFLWFVFFIVTKKKFYLAYIFVSLIIVTGINIPWFAHKKNVFGTMFSINLHEVQNRKNILKSEAWDYMLKINPRPFVDAPYWYTLPHSFSSILIADTFSDYYNLFNHVDNLNTLPANQKIETENGRYTTLALIQSMLWANRFGLALVLIWIFGGIGWLIASLRKKKFDKYRVYLFFLAACGICALAYNNLRYPYLDRGVLKSQFIFFTLFLGIIFQAIN